MLRSLARQLGQKVDSSITDVQPLLALVRQACAGRRVLLVLDDVWHQKVAALFCSTVDRTQGSCVVMTSRDEHCLRTLVDQGQGSTSPLVV